MQRPDLEFPTLLSVIKNWYIKRATDIINADDIDDNNINSYLAKFSEILKIIKHTPVITLKSEPWYDECLKRFYAEIQERKATFLSRNNDSNRRSNSKNSDSSSDRDSDNSSSSDNSSNSDSSSRSKKSTQEIARSAEYKFILNLIDILFRESTITQILNLGTRGGFKRVKSMIEAGKRVKIDDVFNLIEEHLYARSYFSSGDMTKMLWYLRLVKSVDFDRHNRRDIIESYPAHKANTKWAVSAEKSFYKIKHLLLLTVNKLKQQRAEEEQKLTYDQGTQTETAFSELVMKGYTNSNTVSSKFEDMNDTNLETVSNIHLDSLDNLVIQISELDMNIGKN